MSKLGEILRKRRKELNLSIEEIAERIGKSARTYQYYEEDREPRHHVMQKLAQVLQFDPADIYEENIKKEEKDEIKLPNEVERSIDAITIIARANEKLADSNQRLTLMLEQERKAVIVQTESPQVVPAMLSGIRELLVDVALGKKFQTRQEVHALLNKAAPVVEANTFVKDTQKG